MATTPNYGWTIPLGGTTPGALNNTTAGTYPKIWSDTLLAMDSDLYGTANLVPSAGININGNIDFNGYNLTGAGSLAATTFTASSGAFDLITPYTANHGITLQPTAANNAIGITINNTTTLTTGYSLVLQNNGTTTNQFDAIGNLHLGLKGGTASLTPVLYLNAASSSTAYQSTITGSSTGLAYGVPSATTHTWKINSVTALAMSSTTLGIGANAGTASLSPIIDLNAASGGTAYLSSIKANGATSLDTNIPTGLIYNWNVNSVNQMSLNGSAALNLGLNGGVSGTVAPSLLFNAASSSNSYQSSLTAASASGALTFNVPTGASYAFDINSVSEMALSVSSSSAVLDLNASGGTTGTVTPAIHLNAAYSSAAYQQVISGSQTGINYLSTSQHNFGGHLNTFNTTAPTVGSYAGTSTTYWGTTANVTITGTDTAFVLQFQAGSTTSSISAGTLLFTITLNAAYSTQNKFVVYGNFAGAGTTITNQAGTSPTAGAWPGLYCVATSASTINVYAVAAFTPIESDYHNFNFFTMGVKS